MGEAAKAVLWCLAAQGLFVLRARLAPAVFRGESVMAVTALACAVGGALAAVIWWDEVRSALKPKPLIFAVVAAALGVVAAEALELAGWAAAGIDFAWFARAAVPILALIVATALRREAFDLPRTAGVVVGTAAVIWLAGGSDWASVRDLGDASAEGLICLAGAALAVAASLVAAQALVQATTPGAATALMLVAGAVMAGGAAHTEFAGVISAAASSGKTLGITLAYAVGGTALAYFCLFGALTRLRAGAVGASWLFFAVWGVVWMALRGEAVSWQTATAAAVAGGAFLLAVWRESAA
jgi:drug/metabolite transporter (DMT)-like permease